MTTLLGVLAVFALVFINGFFVAAEFALVGARRTRIAQLASEGHAGARAAQNAIEHLDNYIAATQLGITLASLGLGWIGEPAIAHLLEAMLDMILPEDMTYSLSHTVTIAIAFSLITTLHIVLGELAPKSIALQLPEKTSIMVARPTSWFLKLFRPIIYVMNGIGNAVIRLMGFKPASGHEQVHSAEELIMLVHSAREAGVLEDGEERLIQRVFDFSDIHIRAVMQPRVEVEALAMDSSLPDLLEKVSAGPFSRYPVYQDSIDMVVGILHAKDLLSLVVHQPELLSVGAVDFDLSTLLHTPLYFPAMASVDKVLEQMQRTNTHLTIVVDEYGGMAGMATMEDILEELVGEVQDEFDPETTPIHVDEGVVMLDGLVSLSDVTEQFGPPDFEAQSATIGGYIAECLDRIPSKGDTVRFGKYDVYVDEMDEMRVARVYFVRRADETAETDVDDVIGIAPVPPAEK